MDRTITLPKFFYTTILIVIISECAVADSILANQSTDRLENQNQVTFDQAVEAARRFLSVPEDQEKKLAGLLKRYPGAIDPVLQACQRPVKKEYQYGLVRHQHFSIPSLRKKFPDDLLYFYVPDNYRPATPFGLLIFMHGGDRNTPRTKAEKVVSRGRDDPDSYKLRPFIENIPFITVAPSAPWSPECNQRWNVPQADEYIAAVIEETRYRYNIDKNRIILAGQSMGGFGAFHLCQRLGDRIAGGIMAAGAWKKSNFRCLIGTPIYIFHGVYDSAPGYSNTSRFPARPNTWTGISYSRAAHQLMKEYGVEHVFHEFEGGHLIDRAGQEPAKFFQWMLPLKRDPYARKVVAITPRGSWHKTWIPTLPSPHYRWISINQIGPGTIDYDKIVLTGPEVAETMEQYKQQGYKLEKIPMPGGMVEAELKPDNRIKVKTQNVRSFSLWLHPAMVDFSRPIRLTVDNKVRSYRVQAGLVDALRSYKRRNDWGLIYYAELLIKP